jgi:DDE family transposase
VVCQAGGVLLVETVRKSGLDQAVSAALSPWRKRRAVHDPGKVLLDVALAVALGGDCLTDVSLLRAEPGVFGPVASDPAISRLIDTLAGAGPKALSAIRSARAAVRQRVWSLAGDHSRVGQVGQVVVDIDAALVTSHAEKEDAAPTWKKTFGHHPLLAFIDHGPAGTGEPAAAMLRPGNAARTPRATTSPSPNSLSHNCPPSTAEDDELLSAPTPPAAPTPSSTGSPGGAGGCPTRSG